MTRNLTVVSIVCLLFSCKNAHNFHKQKYTKLKSKKALVENIDETFYINTADSLDYSADFDNSNIVEITSDQIDKTDNDEDVLIKTNDFDISIESSVSNNIERTENQFQRHRKKLLRSMELKKDQFLKHHFSNRKTSLKARAGYFFGTSPLITIIAGILILIGGLLLMSAASELFWGLVALLLICIGGVYILLGIIMLLLGY